jgi:tetratricopeptide (TPR) repeat protein
VWEVLRAALPLVLLAWAGLAFAAPARAEDRVDFDALWNFGDPAATEAKFREVLPKVEAAGDPDRHAQLLTQIARTHGLRKQFAEAHALLDRVEKMLGDRTKTARVRYHLERGRTFNSSKDKEAARTQFLAAWDLAKAEGLDGYAVDAAHMMAIAETGDAVLRWNLDALALAERSSDPEAKKWLGALANNIGWTYHAQGDYEKALELFRKALAFREQKKNPADVRIAKWCVARALRSLNRVDESLAIQRDLEREFAAAGKEDGYVFEEIGECLHAQGKAAEATPYFAKALPFLEKALDPQDDAKRLERVRSLAKP